MSDDVLLLEVAAGSGTGCLARMRARACPTFRAPGMRAELRLYELGLLEGRGVRAVAVDRPGCGATDPLDDLDRLAGIKDAVTVAEHLGMARFVVHGTSAGSQYAAACAVLVPDRVRAVILTSAGPWPSGIRSPGASAVTESKHP